MISVRFLDRYRNPSPLNTARSVERVSKNGFAVAVKDVGNSLTAFAYEGRAIVCTETSRDLYCIVDIFEIDKSGNLTCGKLDLKKPENLTVAVAVSGMLRKTHKQNASLWLFAACIVMCWLNSNWLRLVTTVIQTLVHLGAFMASHYVKHMCAVTGPVTVPVYFEPRLDSTALSNVLFLFWEIKVANHAVAYLCYRVSGKDVSMDVASWVCMGLLTIWWDMLIALCT